MDYLEPKNLEGAPEHLRSATGNPTKERIEGGFNTYDGVLKLVDIITYTISIPEQVFSPEGSVSYSQEDTVAHDVGQTPFVEVEWRDPSSVGSGETNFVNITCDYNQSQLRLSFSQVVNRFGPSWGEPPVFPNLPAATYNVKLYVFHLNTKRRLDTYTK